jgi:adenosylcobinamide-phosphate synthase
MEQLIHILLSEYWWPFWVLLLILLIERGLPWPDKYHPLKLAQLLAIKMADKVLHAKPRSSRQQKLSGALAAAVLLFPVCILLSVLILLAAYPIAFDALMLLVALRFQPIISTSQQVTRALTGNKKVLARHTVAQMLLRETDKMSAVGITKANVEALLLRYFYQYSAVIFWYVVAGGSGALIYRLLFEFSQCWNTKIARFRHFGWSLRHLLNILQWIPSKLTSLSIILAGDVMQGLKAIGQGKSYVNSHFFILNISGASLGLQLSGPKYYEQQKFRSINCGGPRQVILADINRTLRLLNRATSVYLGIFFVGYALSVLVFNS